MKLISRGLLVCFLILTVCGAVSAQDAGTPDTLRLAPTNSGVWTISSEADSIYVVEMWGWTDNALGGASLPFRIKLNEAQRLAHRVMDTVIVVDNFVMSTTMPATTSGQFQKSSITDPTNPFQGFIQGLFSFGVPPPNLWPINTKQKIGDIYLKATRVTELPNPIVFVLDSNFWQTAGTFKFTPRAVGTVGFAPQFVIATVTINNLVSGADDELTDHLAIPASFQLNQNFPNPFNPSTTIKFYNAMKGHVQIDVFNIMGQRVRTLTDDEMDIGWQEVVWDGSDSQGEGVASGIYFYKMSTGSFVETKKMLLMK